MQDFPDTLLEKDEPPAFEILRARSHSPFVILCDHASKRIPRKLQNLGLPQREIVRHIGWDIGALQTSLLLSEYLDAPLVYQNYSRLVIDCNRQTNVPSAIPVRSERTDIPGNTTLDETQRQFRINEIFMPYHEAISTLLEQRKEQGLPTCLIAMHSFTPVFMEVKRPWQVGVLFDRFPEYARLVLTLLQEEHELAVGENEPYAIGDNTDYAVPVHAYGRALPYVEIEIRQDLITNAEGQNAWANRFKHVLPTAWERYCQSTRKCRQQ